jgi:hypothetical protein
MQLAVDHLTVNGVDDNDISFTSKSELEEGDWSHWHTTDLRVQVHAGENTLRLVSVTQSGPNLDSLIVTEQVPQWEAPAATGSPEPQCRVVAPRCLATQWQSAAPTLTSDRVCSAISTCAVGAEWQRAGPTPTSDRDCRAVAT